MAAQALFAAMTVDATSHRGAVACRDTHPASLGEPVGRFHARWRGDPLPGFAPLAGLSIRQVDDARLIAEAANLPKAEYQSRTRQGHQPWLAQLKDQVVAWGWCATTELTIGELELTCHLPSGNRYLWDFFTVPRWRGHGIYPRLLHAIVASEPDAERFWVGHDLPNVASARGIVKAGFREVGLLYRTPDGDFTLEPNPPLERAVAASRLFGVSLAAPPLGNL